MNNREYMYEDYPIDSDTVSGGGFEAIVYPKKTAKVHKWEIYEGGDAFYIRSVLCAFSEQLLNNNGIAAADFARNMPTLPTLLSVDRMVIVLENRSKATARFRSKLILVVRRQDITQKNRV